MTVTPKLIADFSVQDNGSICLLVPQTAAAYDWIDTFLPQERTTWGSAIVIEPRYLPRIVDGFTSDGLSL